MNLHRSSVFLLVVAVIGLVTLGLIMLSSTGAYARESAGHATAMVTKQAMWLGIGMALCVLASLMDYDRWRQTWWIWFAASLVLLALCLVPHIGHRINGSARWLRLAGMTLQPSELAKLAGVIALAWWFSRGHADKSAKSEDDDSATAAAAPESTFWRGFVVPLAGMALPLALIAPEVDMGTTALLGATTFLLMFVAGTRWRYLAPLILACVATFIFALTKMPVRLGRLLAYLNPDKFPAEAYQQVQGLIALGSGGIEGLGLGLGRQKMEYLPFAHTDSIFPVIGEELGLRLTLSVVFAFVVIVMSGMVISVRARDRFGMLLGFGIVALISLQAVVNIGVNTMLLPNKGMPLPFISYGGSNLVYCLLCVGILINIWRKGLSDKEVKSNANVRLGAKIGRRPVRL